MAITDYATYRPPFDSDGDPLCSFQDDSGRVIQGVSVLDGEGIPSGTASNPLLVDQQRLALLVHRSSALQISEVIDTEGGSVYNVGCIHEDDSVDDRHLMIFNRDSVPANGTAPSWSIKVPAGSQVIADMQPAFLGLGAGITLCLSTTAVTYTAVPSAECIFQIAYWNG